MNLLGIKNRRTTPLYSHSNGIVGRHILTISNYLSLFVLDIKRDWDKLIPRFLLLYRSSQHDTTGFTPSLLLTHIEIKLPTDLMYGSPTDPESEPSLEETSTKNSIFREK